MREDGFDRMRNGNDGPLAQLAGRTQFNNIATGQSDRRWVPFFNKTMID